jgi:hypothetical protein
MEHRVELEQLLLDGLPDQERRQTIHSMQRATDRKLAHLQRQSDSEDTDHLMASEK